ncbi:MAG: hypothetical protein ACK56F_22475, partial [bacterium]
VEGERGDLLIRAAIHDPAFRKTLDANHNRVFFGPVGHSLLDPAGDDPEFVALLLHPLTAAVGRLANRLVEQQALGGRRDRQATTLGLFDEELVVFVRIKSQERQLKAVLPARFPVAA